MLKKQIFRSMMKLTLVISLILTILLGVLLYLQISSNTRNDLKRQGYSLSGYDTVSLIEFLQKQKVNSTLRYSVIDKNGEVLFDTVNKELSNHLDREEIKQALKKGEGEMVRHSETLGTETLYFSIALDDGNVLRLARTVSNVRQLFIRTIPAIIISFIISLILSYLMSRKLTRQIIEPINKIDINNLNPPYDELTPLAKTISHQQVQIENQVSELKKRAGTFEAIMQSMDEGLILVDKSEKILLINDSAKNLLDSNNSDEKYILELIRDVPFYNKITEALRGSRTEYEFGTKSKIYKVILSPIADGGIIMLFVDITEKYEAEKRRREFSANVSHELKTPLTTIFGNAEMLKNNMVKPGDEPIFYDKIQKEATRLITLVEDILLISKLDEGSPDIDLEDVRLDLVAKEVIDSLKDYAISKEVTINFTCNEASMKALYSQIFELFHNLIENAVKYNKQGGSVEVSVNATTNIEILITDTGIGIPAVEQDRVFERFYRVDKSRYKETGGSGLGLAIAKHIVSTYKGTIKLESEVDKGTMVKIVFGNNTIIH